MKSVVAVNPADTSYSSIDLERARLDRLHADMREKDREAYDAHIQICMDLLNAEAAKKTIEPFWEAKIGGHGKRDAVAHLMQEASRRITLNQQASAIKATQKGR